MSQKAIATFSAYPEPNEELNTIHSEELGKSDVFKNSYPPGSKSEALHLGVHLILLYFIRILILSVETFFLF